MKRPETFEEAIKYFEKLRKSGDDPQWSIQYWGFGEHFTFWAGYGTFIDFGIDRGSAFGWDKLKKIILESAQEHYDEEKALREGKHPLKPKK